MDYLDHSRSRSSIGPKACTTCAKAKARCREGPRKGVCERCHRLTKTCSAQTPAPPRQRKAPKPTRVAELEKRLQDLTARVESRRLEATRAAQARPPVEAPAHRSAARRFSLPDFRGGAARTRPPYDYLFAPDKRDFEDNHGADRGSDRGPDQGPDQGPENNSPIIHNPPCKAATGRRAHDHELSCSTALQPPYPLLTPNQSSSSSSSTSPAVTGEEPRQQRDPVCSEGAPGQQSSCHSPLHESGDAWYYPSADEARQILETFRHHIVPLFPFIVIPPTTTSEALRQDRPLLWRAIMMEGLRMHARRQVLMGDSLLRDVVSAAFLQPRKSLDLLQAIEVLTAWFCSRAQSFQMTNLLFLLRSICTSLGFNESQESSKEQSRRLASLEQMRAFTGVYYLVTMVFTTSKKPDAFMNTTHLDYCCRILEERMEYPSDQLVVLLVRTQQLSQSISTTLAFRSQRDSLPLPLIIQSFQHQIRHLRSAIPASLGNSVALKTQLHVAEALLYEIALSEDLADGLAPAERVELLWECLVAARSVLEIRFLELPGWDLRIVRNAFDLNKYLTLQIQEYRDFVSARSQADAVDGADSSSNGAPGPAQFQDPYERLHTRLAQLQSCIQAEMAATLPPNAQPHGATEPGPPNAAALVAEERETSGPDMGPPLARPLSVEPLHLDDVFWQDVCKPAEWDANFSTLLGWHIEDWSTPVYSAWPGSSNIPL